MSECTLEREKASAVGSFYCWFCCLFVFLTKCAVTLMRFADVLLKRRIKTKERTSCCRTSHYATFALDGYFRLCCWHNPPKSSANGERKEGNCQPRHHWRAIVRHRCVSIGSVFRVAAGTVCLGTVPLCCRSLMFSPAAMACICSVHFHVS